MKTREIATVAVNSVATEIALSRRLPNFFTFIRCIILKIGTSHAFIGDSLLLRLSYESLLCLDLGCGSIVCEQARRAESRPIAVGRSPVTSTDDRPSVVLKVGGAKVSRMSFSVERSTFSTANYLACRNRRYHHTHGLSHGRLGSAAKRRYSVSLADTFLQFTRKRGPESKNRKHFALSVFRPRHEVSGTGDIFGTPCIYCYGLWMP